MCWWSPLTFTTMNAIRVLIPLFVASAGYSATVSVTDDFNGATIDSSKWSTILPFGQSSVSQGGGYLTTAGRGILASVQQFGPALTISGSFTMQNDFEDFVVGFRTDLSPLPDPDLFNTLSGMFVNFSNDANQVHIQGRGYSPQNSVPGVSFKNYTLTTGETYFFTITDNGSDINVFINGQQELSATTGVSTGGHVAFYGREFSNTSTRIDAVAIFGQAVPDDGSIGVYLSLACLALFVVRRSNDPFSRKED